MTAYGAGAGAVSCYQVGVIAAVVCTVNYLVAIDTCAFGCFSGQMVEGAGRIGSGAMAVGAGAAPGGADGGTFGAGATIVIASAGADVAESAVAAFV